jgi:hypothetical protein
MKKLFLFATSLLFVAGISAQNIREDYSIVKDSIQIGPGPTDFLPYTEKGYTIVLPETGPAKGLIVLIEDQRIDLTKVPPGIPIYPPATKNGFAVLYMSTGVPIDLFFNDQSLNWVDKTIGEVLNKYKIANKNIFFLGISLAGHRALKYVEYCHSGKSKLNPDTSGIILCESAIDWTRMWYEGKKAIRDNFAPSSVWEGKALTYLLEKNLGGTPADQPERYARFSAYTYFDDKQDLAAFKNISARCYSEPATYYWMNIKGKTAIDTNFPDMVGLINDLKLTGNKNAELIVFDSNKTDMTKRNPDQTWKLVDKDELVNWMKTQVK